MKPIDYYAVLSLEAGAGEEDIRTAYRTLVKIAHPDKPTGDVEKYKAICDAYEVLNDPAKKLLYDATAPKPSDFADHTLWFKQRVEYYSKNASLAKSQIVSSLQSGPASSLGITDIQATSHTKSVIKKEPSAIVVRFVLANPTYGFSEEQQKFRAAILSFGAVASADEDLLKSTVSEEWEGKMNTLYGHKHDLAAPKKQRPSLAIVFRLNGDTSRELFTLLDEAHQTQAEKANKYPSVDSGDYIKNCALMAGLTDRLNYISSKKNDRGDIISSDICNPKYMEYLTKILHENASWTLTGPVKGTVRYPAIRLDKSTLPENLASVDKALFYKNVLRMFGTSERPFHLPSKKDEYPPEDLDCLVIDSKRSFKLLRDRKAVPEEIFLQANFGLTPEDGPNTGKRSRKR